MGATHRKTSLRALAVGAVMALLLGPALSVSAAPVDVSFTLTGGSLALGTELVLDVEPSEASGVVGTWDDETGEFSGELVLAPLSLEVPNPLGVPPTINVNITIDPAPVTGVIPPDGSAGSVSTSLTIGIFVVELDLTCELPLADLVLTAQLSDDGQVLTVSGGGFEAPVPGGDALCAVAGGALDLPSTDTALALTFEAGEITPTTTTTAPEPTTTVPDVTTTVPDTSTTAIPPVPTSAPAPGPTPGPTPAPVTPKFTG